MDAQFEALRALSARVGADPLLVQAAGGNTSLKIGDTMWIKASGTWLMNALSSEIMVPVALPPLLKAVDELDPAAEKAQDFVLSELNPRGLRPSIETTVHALMPHRVVVHVHCVETIALAVREDAERLIAERLTGIEWAFVPYCRPGLPLARGIAERMRPGVDVLILGNHGLVVAGETVADAEALLEKVCALLAATPRPMPAPDIDALTRLADGSAYRLPEAVEAHGVATDLESCRMAAPGTLYPDHVVFLGKGSVVARPGEDAAATAARIEAECEPTPVTILFPGKGVLIRADANAGAQALARCIADVTARIPPQARLNYLADEEASALTEWDAEKYRQQLTERMGGATR